MTKRAKHGISFLYSLQHIDDYMFDEMDPAFGQLMLILEPAKRYAAINELSSMLDYLENDPDGQFTCEADPAITNEFKGFCQDHHITAQTHRKHDDE